jgi:hypothetical protein
MTTTYKSVVPPGKLEQGYQKEVALSSIAPPAGAGLRILRMNDGGFQARVL